MRINYPATKRKFNALDYESLEVCPWCNSDESEQWGKDVEPFNSVLCKRCGLVYVNHRLNSEGRRKYYKNYYSTEHQAVPEAKVRNRMYKLEFDLICNFLQKGNVLDVGCSGGQFLDYFSKAGFDCYGVEPAEDAVRIAQSKFEDKIVQGTLLNSQITEEFDLIILRGTIEHIPEAKQTLVKAISLLRSEAPTYIYITSTPNAESICSNIFKTNWTQHLPEEHIYHLSKRHFDDLFADNGLGCVTERYFYEETPYASIEEDILKVAKAIKLKREGKSINFKSPPFYGNMMSLVYGKNI